MAEFWAQIRHTSDQETVLLGGILGGGPGADPEHAAGNTLHFLFGLEKARPPAGGAGKSVCGEGLMWAEQWKTNRWVIKHVLLRKWLQT